MQTNTCYFSALRLTSSRPLTGPDSQLLQQVFRITRGLSPRCRWGRQHARRVITRRCLGRRLSFPSPDRGKRVDVARLDSSRASLVCLASSEAAQVHCSVFLLSDRTARGTSITRIARKASMFLPRVQCLFFLVV